MDGVDATEGADMVGQTGDFGDIVNRAHGIGGQSYGDDPGAVVDFAGKVGHVERAIGLVDVGDPDDDAAFFEGFPGGEVGVMVEAG